MCIITVEQITQVIAESPGITTQEIVQAFPCRDSDEYRCMYHGVRLKLRLMAKRGDIHRSHPHHPGEVAHWYSGRGSQ